MSKLSILLCLLHFSILLFFPISTTASKTIIDVLSDHPECKNTIRALQRTQLIRVINHLKDVTLFCPTNSAYKGDYEDPTDVSRELMLYHLANATFKREKLIGGKLLETKLVKDKLLGEGDIGQRIRIDTESSEIFVGNARLESKEDLVAVNGMVHVISDLLSPPTNIFDTLRLMEGLSLFLDYIRFNKLEHKLTAGHHLTVFAPTNDAFTRQFKKHERDYLTGICEPASTDLGFLLTHHLHDGVKYSEDVSYGSSHLPTLQGEPLKLEKTSEGNITVEHGIVTFKDVLAENGVIHIINAVSSPVALRFTILKYLCGLGAIKFKDKLLSFGLRHYIDDPPTPYTILAPPDSHFELSNDDGEINSLLLKYHIFPGKWDLSDLKTGMLVRSEMKTKQLGGRKQRVKVAINNVWYDEGSPRETSRLIKFNDATVIGEPVDIGNSIIYLIDRVMESPGTVIDNLSPNKYLSAFYSFLNASEILETISYIPKVTVFAPNNTAFSKLGLIKDYLFHPTGRSDLQSIMKYHVINKVLYSEEISEGKTVHETMDGSHVTITKMNGVITLRNKNSTSRVTEVDTLMSNGVLHVTDSFEMPSHVNITIRKILQGIEATTMLKMFHKSNLSEVLDNSTDAYTVLVPTEEAFANAKLNFTNRDRIERILRLHIIHENIPHLIDGIEFPTLHSDDARLILKRTLLGDYKFALKGPWQIEERASILNHGRATHGGGVYLIDKVLFPHRATNSVGKMFVGVFIGLVAAVFLGLGGTFGWHGWRWWRDWRERVMPFEVPDEDPDETTPLIG
ncbi:5898_t:CDS:2 [Paraglomus occultum]|uniref:5898_t:CDS:1 n=1 Tax=Paraglomus occultum TaxID=144539 RepID=A0A9N9BWY8_9GLOM|nr:5898_t:CDS:2 [Paraglomus occultum]